MKRKIAAIFAADIAGYSRLVAEDEEETLRRLASYRSVTDDFIARAGGRIFNTAGDAVLAEFPSAVEAVRCAIDIQESLRTRNMAYAVSRHMSYRIGITIGDVVERNGDLLGDGVNIAARLEGLAEVGGICISRAVHEQVVNKLSVQFADIGAQEVKNIPTPVHAYMVAMRREDGTYASPQHKKKTAASVRAPNWLWPAVVAAVAAVAIGALASVYSSAIKHGVQPAASSTTSTPAASVPVASVPAPQTPVSSAAAPPLKPEVMAIEPDASSRPTVEPMPAERSPEEGRGPAPTIRQPNPLFTEADVKTIATIAEQKHFEMPPFQIEALDEKLPVQTRRFVGVWVSKVGFNGVGRHAMLIVTSVSIEGALRGYFMWGPPTKKSMFQTPAGYRRFSTTINKDSFEFSRGSTISTVTLLPTNVVRVRDEYSDGKSATILIEPVWTMAGR
ncbi:adenylate/guanylate cyclase domain-containing protein [Bradyrhizobium sp. JYMT SZCCT0428]|uniref:adenylate/guanylate cyclase domain-containing protein n=1 Tax=Bradyrhizobium sp. JYMT SZCCT0428 TaxID=2807673 RepID=UPI002010E478|nr:adenylate/guanylate cyclase domain-containing protein [Bradyrhizobium sp. JYMT SZCCT0428]